MGTSLQYFAKCEYNNSIVFSYIVVPSMLFLAHIIPLHKIHKQATQKVIVERTYSVLVKVSPGDIIFC